MRDDQLDRVIKQLKEVDVTILQAAHVIATAVNRNTEAIKEQTGLMTDEIKEQMFAQMMRHMEMEARGQGIIIPDHLVGER